MDELADSNIQDDDVEHNERDRETDNEEDLSGRSIVEPNRRTSILTVKKYKKSPSALQDNRGSTEEVQVEKDITEEELDELLEEKEEPHILDTPVDNIETEDEKARREDYDAQHATDEWKSAKEAWKAEHPNETEREEIIIYKRAN